MNQLNCPILWYPVDFNKGYLYQKEIRTHKLEPPHHHSVDFVKHQIPCLMNLRLLAINIILGEWSINCNNLCSINQCLNYNETNQKAPCSHLLAQKTRLYKLVTLTDSLQKMKAPSTRGTSVLNEIHKDLHYCLQLTLLGVYMDGRLIHLSLICMITCTRITIMRLFKLISYTEYILPIN